jgi:adenylate kinase
MALDLLVLGPPGAGKGTQAKRLAAGRGIAHVATGDMLREAMAAGTELGLRVTPIYERGDLVPDDLMVALIRERLDAGDTEAGFVLDGFPRTIPQAEALDDMLTEIDRGLACVLEFQLPDEEAVRRLHGRAEQEGRADDTPETIRRRMQVYHEQTEPLVAYYLGRGILVGIPADGTPEAVAAEIEAVLGRVEERERA